MAVPVHLADRIEALLQGLAIGCEATYGEDEVRIVLIGRAAADLEDLGVVSCVDAVAGSVSGVAREDGEVGTGDGEDGTTIVGVAIGTSISNPER